MDKIKVLCVCPQNLTAFIDSPIELLKPEVEVDKWIVTDPYGKKPSLKDYDLVWMEWGSELTGHFTTDPASRNWLGNHKVINRVHGYEVYYGHIRSVDYLRVNSVFFVAEWLAELALANYPGHFKNAKVYAINNCLHPEEFPLMPVPDHRSFANIGSVARVQSVKQPLVAMGIGQHLYRHNRGGVTWLGQPQEADLWMALITGMERERGFVLQNGKVPKAEMYKWWADKTHVLCTSIRETQGLAYMEAMLTGRTPLIYNFPFADRAYPRECLFDNPVDVLRMVDNDPRPEYYRQFVIDRFGPGVVKEQWMRMIKETLDAR